MRDKAGILKWWEWFDRFLLMLVFVLLAFSWWDLRQTENRFRKNGATLSERVNLEPLSQRPAQPAVHVSDGLPVSLSRSRVSHIARSMVESEWENMPSSPAADMREQNGFYDILFALPHNMDVGSVKVSTAGNLLTLFVNVSGLPAATFVKQFYIPCGAEQAGAVETSVSNDIVRVRIRQPGN
jgi:hypothetical protein